MHRFICEDAEDNTARVWLSKRVIRNVPLHWHSYYEVELVVDGEGIQTVNGQTSDISRGSLTMLTPHDFHRVEASRGSCLTLRTFRFYQDNISDDVLCIIERNSPPYQVKYDGKWLEYLNREYDILKREITGSLPFHELAATRRIECTCIDIIRKAIDDRKNQSADLFKEPPKHIEMFRPIIIYISEHLSEKLTRESVAAALHFSPGYFSTLFKETLGITFSDYLMDCRMQRALQLVRTGNMTIENIIAESGFFSASLFYRKFIEYYGATPTEIRKREKDAQRLKRTMTSLNDNLSKSSNESDNSGYFPDDNDL